MRKRTALHEENDEEECNISEEQLVSCEFVEFVAFVNVVFYGRKKQSCI